MSTTEVDSTEVVPSCFDVDDMEDPDQYTEDVIRNDDLTESFLGGMFMLRRRLLLTYL